MIVSDSQIKALRRFSRTTPADAAPAAQQAVEPDTLVLGMGNSGEAVTLRIGACAAGDGKRLALCGINNDALAPRPLTICTPAGETETLNLDERLVFTGENPRDSIADYPLLERRYSLLLRGIPVLETYPRAGYGGNGQPVISGLDIDLNIGRVCAFFSSQMRRLRGDTIGGRSDWERLQAQVIRQATAGSRPLRIVMIGGGSGSMGNAGHQLLPYIIRHLLHEAQVPNYELWGVVLGPQAFNGLTHYTRFNYRALLESLDWLSRHGQQRAYINGLELELRMPPYDRLFLLDAPHPGGDGGRATEVELEQFLDRSALALYLVLLRGTVWSTIASHLANDDLASLDGRLRYLHTIRAGVASLDRMRLKALLTPRLEAQLLTTLIQRMAA